MTKDVMIREVTDRATDLFNIDVDENHPKKKFTQKEITSVLRAFADCVIDNITENKTEKIPLPGVGNFAAKHVAEKSGTVQLGDNKGSTWHKDAEDQLVFKVSTAVKTLG